MAGLTNEQRVTFLMEATHLSKEHSATDSKWPRVNSEAGMKVWGEIAKAVGDGVTNEQCRAIMFNQYHDAWESGVLAMDAHFLAAAAKLGFDYIPVSMRGDAVLPVLPPRPANRFIVVKMLFTYLASLLLVLAAVFSLLGMPRPKQAIEASSSRAADVASQCEEAPLREALMRIGNQTL